MEKSSSESFFISVRFIVCLLLFVFFNVLNLYHSWCSSLVFLCRYCGNWEVICSIGHYEKMIPSPRHREKLYEWITGLDKISKEQSFDGNLWRKWKWSTAPSYWNQEKTEQCWSWVHRTQKINKTHERWPNN